MGMTIVSEVIEPGDTIPTKYTGEGADVSPPLTWSGVPAEAVELALIVDDPDAPGREPWVHWVMYKIPAGTTGLAEGVPKAEMLGDPAGARQGVNSWPRVGYGGPMPPPGHGVHHYHFTLYALDAALPVGAGLTKGELLAAMEAHVLAEAELVGTYER